MQVVFKVRLWSRLHPQHRSHHRSSFLARISDARKPPHPPYLSKALTYIEVDVLAIWSDLSAVCYDMPPKVQGGLTDTFGITEGVPL